MTTILCCEQRPSPVLSHTVAFSLPNRVRSTSNKYRRYQQDETIQREVFFHDTLPLLLPGVEYDYREEVEDALKEYNKACYLPLPLPIVVEEEEEEAEEGVVEGNAEAEAETKI
jgi:hypothetical protein